MLKNKLPSRGLTLIELLVVIAVIGFFSSVFLANMDLLGQKKRAKISKSLNFSHSLQNNLGSEAAGIWEFNEGSGSVAVDRSGYKNNGAISGAVYTSDTPQKALSQAQGEGKYALSFDGVDDYVDAGTGIDYASFPGLTLEAWVKRSTVGSRDYIISAGYAPYQFEIWANNTVGIEIQIDSAYYNLVSSKTFTSTDWSHLAFTHNLSSGVWYIYVNSEIFANGVRPGAAYTGTNATRIGNHTGAADGPFGGLIDEVRIYGQNLTIGQIQKHYTEGLAKYLTVK